MDAYSNLMDKAIYQTIKSMYTAEFAELMTSYVMPQPAFAVRGNSMLDGAYGANPFSSSIECDKLDISPIVMSNGQAQFGEGYDMGYTFSNRGDEGYTRDVELNRGDGQRGVRSNVSVNTSWVPGIEKVVVPRQEVSGMYGDDIPAYQRLRFKYSRTLHTIYTEQGKRIKMRKHNKSVSSNRQGISTVVIGDVSEPVVRLLEANHNECSMLFLDHIVVPCSMPKYAVNYISSEQFLYVLGVRMQEGEMEMPFPVAFSGGYLEKKYFEAQVIDPMKQQSWDAVIPKRIICEIVQMEEWEDNEVIAKLPMILKSDKFGVLNGYEVSAHKVKECVFSYFETLEKNNSSVIYDAPFIGTRIFIDSILNSIYSYYDNLRFTPVMESIYVKLYPALYAITSQMHNIGFLTTEFEEYHREIISKIKRGVLAVKGINDSAELELYIDTVFRVLHEISGMYSRPTSRKCRSNKVMAWLTCGGFGENIRRITELVAYSGLDVTTTGKDLINLELVQLSLLKDKGEGVYNQPVGYCDVKAALCDSVAAEKMIKNLRSRTAESTASINLNDAKSVFFNDTGRTLRLRYGSHSILTVDEIDSSTFISQADGIEAFNKWMQLIEGYTQTILHSPHYFLLTEGVFTKNSERRVTGFARASLRAILWGAFYGKGASERFLADTGDHFLFDRIAKGLLAQPLRVFVEGANGPEAYSMNSTYIKSHVPGILYSPKGQAVNLGNGETGVESILLAKRIMDFINSPRQHLYSVGVMSTLISEAANAIGSAEPERVFEVLAERYPSYEFDEETVARILTSLANGKDIFGDEVLQEQSKKYTQAMTKFIREMVLARNEALSNETTIVSGAYARGKYEYSGGRPSFIKQGKLYRHGVTGKLMFTNGLIDIEVQDSIKADVICYSRLQGAPSIFKPVAKRF